MVKKELVSYVLEPMNDKAAEIIQNWEYPAPYDVYSFKGTKNGYLLNRSIWGIEQFYMIYGNGVVGQVACQFADDVLWVGWSFASELCGKGGGSLFIRKCVDEIRRVKSYHGPLYLRVAAWNERAIKAYLKAGFAYVRTIEDEIAGTNKPEDFWVMKLD